MQRRVPRDQGKSLSFPQAWVPFLGLVLWARDWMLGSGSRSCLSASTIVIKGSILCLQAHCEGVRVIKQGRWGTGRTGQGVALQHTKMDALTVFYSPFSFLSIREHLFCWLAAGSGQGAQLHMYFVFKFYVERHPK